MITQLDTKMIVRFEYFRLVHFCVNAISICAQKSIYGQSLGNNDIIDCKYCYEFVYSFLFNDNSRCFSDFYQ